MHQDSNSVGRKSCPNSCSSKQPIPSVNSSRLTSALLTFSLAVCTTFLPYTAVWSADVSLQCTGDRVLTTLSSTDWETGLGEWTVDTYAVARPATFDTPDWAVVSSLPEGRSGSAAFVANLDAGDCGADDESGALTLTSPEIVLPGDATELQVSFNHWFQVEYGWDGGNLKISVNGSSFDLVPSSAFTVGPYTETLFEAFDSFGLIYNTNPLAEQDAFTGPEGEQVTGSWSESRVDLLGIAGPGDIVRLQFDFGVDACYGRVGWYVDEVEVYGCAEESPPPATSLTLVKQVVNDNGGSASSSAWTLSANGPTGFSGRGPSVSSGSGFQPGTYDLSESGGPAGYAASAWSCVGGSQLDRDTITVAAGDNATCTITNDDIGPTLKLVKTIVNANGGSVTDPNDFGLRIDGDLVSHNTTYILAAGDHYASEDGLPEYLSGYWGGDCAPDGSVSLQLGQTAVCTITNRDIFTGFQINPGHSGAWWNPATDGQGILIDIGPTEQDMFIAWFTYTDADSENPFEHRWLTAQGKYSGGTAVLQLNETLGGRFDDPQPVTTKPIGEVMLDFIDCQTTEMTYYFHDDDVQGTIELERVIPGSENVCLGQDGHSMQAVDINVGMDGAWYDPLTSGQGFLIDAHTRPEGGTFIFVAWFTYGDDTASGLRWLTAQSADYFEGPTAEIDITETTGGSFGDTLPVVSRETVGTMRIDFEDCSNASFSYSLPRDNAENKIETIRLLAGEELLCEEITGLE